MIRLFLVSLIIFLAGCSSMPVSVHTVDSGESRAMGCLAGTIEITKSGDNANLNTFSRVMFRSTNMDTKGDITYHRSLLVARQEKVYVHNGITGSAFYINIPTGDYELYNVDFYLNSGYVEKTYKAKEDFSILFKIKEGECTYIGSFLANGRYGENLFGMSIPIGGYFTVTNQYDRDIKLIKQHYPESSNVPIFDETIGDSVPPFIFVLPHKEDEG